MRKGNISWLLIALRSQRQQLVKKEDSCTFQKLAKWRFLQENAPAYKKNGEIFHLQI